MARHRALCEVRDHGDRLGRSKCDTYTHHRQSRPEDLLSKTGHCERPQSITVISATNCPVAVVPAPPAVMVMAPVVPTVPAREPADPAV